jgi:sugar phosphate isomerase/epimerase
MRIKPKGNAEGLPSDVPRVLKMLRAANYQGWFTLEYEDKEDPFVAVPRILNELRPQLA